MNNGKPKAAFDQAMKLAESNPQTCLLSMIAIAEDAKRRGDNALVEKCYLAAVDVDRKSGCRYFYKIIDMCFKLDRPLGSIVALTKNAPHSVRNRGFGAIRDWLARKGRVDEAYSIAREYMPKLDLIHHHRRIGYSCATVKHYDYLAKHDYFGQTIQVIGKMPVGKERDAVISALVNNLTYVARDDTVSNYHLELAEHWAGEIQDSALKGAARKKVLERKRPNTIDKLEERFSEVDSREEKSALLDQIFQMLVAANRLDEADKILGRRLQLIKEQPRPEVVSAFWSIQR